MASSYAVRRETIVLAPADRVHALVVDFRSWRRWSPWDDLDPDMDRTYSGADAGVGARYAWSGNRKAGRGHMEITDATAQRVDIALAFEKPFPSTSTVTSDLTPEGDETHVEWTTSGDMTLGMKVFSLVKPMEELLGPDMEKGLVRLKAAAEADARTT
ncbi:SRPBCC family protein [Phycicoccus sp. BSK3Z-2]|uniref:SRPBCC family protein n=1 Tax=Phycicoccus avicenniae TaxID=2828860 RepID=A0A941D944_9MICO|nr:SRPBCC family protein [Phycicoccus avicenniae]MBR7742757.1 SRPBCC family protein [Phycicoccus avicenniae]